MGRFYQALQRMDYEPAIATGAGQFLIDAPPGAAAAPAVTATPLAAYAGISCETSVRQLSEQLLAMSAGAGIRLIVTGCQPGDGASSIAGALALDIAQRLAARTVLADPRARGPFPPIVQSAGTARRAAGAPLLDVLSGAGAEPAQFAVQIEQTAKNYPICIIDAGAIRLESALLSAIDRDAPVLIVARYGHTERRNLVRTMRTVRASGHRTIGIVFNAVRSPLPAAIHSLFQTGE